MFILTAPRNVFVSKLMRYNIVKVLYCEHVMSKQCLRDMTDLSWRNYVLKNVVMHTNTYCVFQND